MLIKISNWINMINQQCKQQRRKKMFRSTLRNQIKMSFLIVKRLYWVDKRHISIFLLHVKQVLSQLLNSSKN